MLTLPLPPGAEPGTAPEPCPHIQWDPGTQYATWSTGPEGVTAEQLEQRRSDVARQGLGFVGEPHLCYADDGDMYVWAIALI